MDSDVAKILQAAEQMKECFKALEARRSLDAEHYNAVCSAANTFRYFRMIEISRLRAAFDPEYAEEMRKLNLEAKGLNNE